MDRENLPDSPSAETSEESKSGASTSKSSGDLSPKDAEKAQKAGTAVVMRIRGYSKIVFFWPICVLSLIFFFLGGSITEDALLDPNQLAAWWVIVFAINLSVFTYDFGRTNFITLIAILLVLLLGTVALDQWLGGVWSSLFGFFDTIKMNMHPNFYLMMFVVFAFFLVLAIIQSRFNYWQIGHNELVHRHGILGDVRAYSTVNMHVEKEIPDVFEFLLFGSGRLIFKPYESNRSDQKPLVVENVFMINRVEAEVKRHISVLKVEHTNRS